MMDKIKISIHNNADADGGCSWFVSYTFNGTIYPTSCKPNAREAMARAAQLLNIGPIAPQIGPDRFECRDEAQNKKD